MKSAYKSISQGLKEAIEYSEGRESKVKTFKPIHVDVKELRNRLGMTQERFSASFGISLGTLRHWERGDRYPKGPALILLNLLSKEPDTILNVLHRE